MSDEKKLLVEITPEGRCQVDLDEVADVVLHSLNAYKTVSRLNAILGDDKPSAQLKRTITFFAKISQFKLGVKTFKDVVLTDVMLPAFAEKMVLSRGVYVDITKEEDGCNLMRSIDLKGGDYDFDYEDYCRIISSIYGSQKKAVSWSTKSAFEAAKPVNLTSGLRVIHSSGLVEHETSPSELCYPLNIDVMRGYVYSESVDRHFKAAIDTTIRNL